MRLHDAIQGFSVTSSGDVDKSVGNAGERPTGSKAASPVSAFECELIESLKRCSFVPGSSPKRFVRDLPVPIPENFSLTERQHGYLLLIAFRFRRQMPKGLMERLYQFLFNHPEKLEGFRVRTNLHSVIEQ
jgi:hypothetical protein